MVDGSVEILVEMQLWRGGVWIGLQALNSLIRLQSQFSPESRIGKKRTESLTLTAPSDSDRKRSHH